MSVEVSCPGCGVKLKAPDDRIGKKARCKMCRTSFRVPGPVADSLGESQMLSAVGAPGSGLPVEDDDSVPMATAADDLETVPAIEAKSKPKTPSIAKPPSKPAA